MCVQRYGELRVPFILGHLGKIKIGTRVVWTEHERTLTVSSDTVTVEAPIQTDLGGGEMQPPRVCSIIEDNLELFPGLPVLVFIYQSECQLSSNSHLDLIGGKLLVGSGGNDLWLNDDLGSRAGSEASH